MSCSSFCSLTASARCVTAAKAIATKCNDDHDFAMRAVLSPFLYYLLCNLAHKKLTESKKEKEKGRR